MGWKQVSKGALYEKVCVRCNNHNYFFCQDFLEWLWLTPAQSLSAHELFGDDQVKIVKSLPTHYWQAVLFQNQANNTFGIAELHRKLGIFWWARSGTYGRTVKDNQPFSVAGLFSNNKKGKKQFIIGVKVKDINIKYLAFGKGPQILRHGSVQ